MGITTIMEVVQELEVRDFHILSKFSIELTFFTLYSYVRWLKTYTGCIIHVC